MYAFVFQAEQRGALPLILTNGWPSTSVELVPLAQRLSSPSAFGDEGAPAFTVVVPSLPGFPLSPQRPGQDSAIHQVLPGTT